MIKASTTTPATVTTVAKATTTPATVSTTTPATVEASEASHGHALRVRG